MTTKKIDWKSCTVDPAELINTLGTLTDSLVREEFLLSPALELELKRLNTLAMCTMALELRDISEALSDINIGGVAVYLQEEE